MPNPTVPQITDANLTAINAAIDTIRQNLPDLKAISGQTSKHIYHLGLNSISYVESGESVVATRPEILAGTFDKAAFTQRFELTKQYQKVTDGLVALLADINGTNDVEGGKVMDDAGEIYDSAKRGLKNDPSLQGLVDRMAERYAKTKAAKNKAAKSAPAKPTP